MQIIDSDVVDVWGDEVVVSVEGDSIALNVIDRTRRASEVRLVLKASEAHELGNKLRLAAKKAR